MATTTERGYGWDHQQERARLLPRAYGKPCPLCGQPMQRGQRLDLHHLVALAHGGRHGPRAMAHEDCNRRHGQRIAAERRRQRSQANTQRVTNSRAW